MESDAELSFGVGKSSAASRTGRNRLKLPQKPRRGYHRAVTAELAAEFCRRLASGRTLRAVCRDRDMPHHDAVYDEMNRSPAFAEAIARARTESAHGLAMEALDIADSAGPEDNPQLIKNRCDLRRWLANEQPGARDGRCTDKGHHHREAGPRKGSQACRPVDRNGLSVHVRSPCLRPPG